MKGVKLALRSEDNPPIVIEVSGVRIGGGRRVVVAGPCSVESPQQIEEIALALKDMGVDILRGGVFKPRTSPYSFQGLGFEALDWLRRAGDKAGLPIATEVLDPRHVEKVSRKVDLLWIGARNMQNFPLLREVGRSRFPVLLKRGFGNTVEEWLAAAEYILAEGNESVGLIERGIRTFEPSSRFTLDVAAIAVVKTISRLPVIVDPSHPAGKRELVPPLAKAGLAAGADGIMVEVHSRPDEALSDAAQQLDLEGFSRLLGELRWHRLL
ncbi:MAG: 3-deoxy-7-phosphoheptulonate synthase [Aeropyrum sp.]|nr:3-deoxy-7-phosphoheptulonate synthase [Aeropyrum sp.]MCE4616839.1 3-deoxy-7-phosphoheptulonate synthase [Aeropyrum sp.]